MDSGILVSLAIIVSLGALAQWVGWALRLPSILLLLIFGFLSGPILGWVDPDRIFGPLLLPFVSVAVALILFEGGLTLRFAEIRGVGNIVGRLVTIGALVTWILAAFAAWLTIGLSLQMVILFGAILTVTGPTVVLPLLRQIKLIGQTGTILKWEGIVIDPLGALLAVLVFEIITSPEDSETLTFIVLSVLRTIFSGGGLGLAAAGLLVLAIRRYWIPDYLQTALALMLVIGVLVVANRLQHEAGLLAVTVMGIALANQRYANVEAILVFKENLRVFLLSAVFILLSARVRLTDLQAVGPETAVFVLLLILVVRPASVWISTLGCSVSWRERLFMSCMAPRGIVAAAIVSVFALNLEKRGEYDARLLVPVMFATIVGTVLIYGLTASRVAQALKLSDPNSQGMLIAGAGAPARAFATAIKALGFRVVLVDTNRANISAAQMEGLAAYYGSIVGEGIEDKLDLDGIGHLLAMTPNDEVNVLAVRHFVRRFSRANVFQFPPGQSASGKASLDPRLLGRWLFRNDVTWEAIENWWSRGGKIKTTKLTEAFDYDAFLARYNTGAILLAVLREDRRLVVASADAKLEPKPGQTIVTLLSPGIDAPSTASDHP